MLREGYDARSLHPDSLYRDAALLRGNELIAGTIRDNLVLGRRHYPGRLSAPH